MKRWPVIVAAVFGVALVVAMWAALRREPDSVIAPSSAEVAGTRTVELYFPGRTGGLQREAREILGSDFLEEDVRRTVEELIAGPETGASPIPPATRLLSVFHDHAGEITLSFSDHLRTDHPGGSEAEIETLRCLVATIGTNFPEVDRVRILVDGETVATLAGHTDLGRPLRVDDYR